MKMLLQQLLFVLGCIAMISNIDAGLLAKNKISFVKVDYITSDPDIMNIDFTITQGEGDSEQKVNGYISFAEICDTETFSVHKVMSSPDSMDLKDMKPVKFMELPRKETKDFMNDVYKPFVMKQIASCSDMPQFDDDWGDRSIKGNYTLTDCVYDTDGLQPIFSKGNYCLLSVITRDVEPKYNGELRVYVKVE